MIHPLFFGLGPAEIAITVLAIIILFGGSKVKGLAKGIGKSIKEINDVKNSLTKDFKDGINDIDLDDK